MLQYLKCFLYIALMITIPSTGLYPHTPAITVHVHETPQELLENNRLLSYDEVLSFLENLENGTLEQICSEDDLEQINIFLANLAEQGMLPGDTEENYALASDIHELLYGTDNPYQYALDFDSDYIFSPALLNSHGEILLCKSWFSKKWEQTKEFVKKHKKAIIIGAAVVVAATVVVCAVVAASTAGAVAATTTAKAAGVASAAAATGASTTGKKEENSRASPLQDEQSEQLQTAPLQFLSAANLPSFLTALNETPMIGDVFQERIYSFKESLAHGPFLQNPDTLHAEEYSFLRYLGSDIAHQVLDGVDQLVGIVPQLLEEVKDIGKLILPELPPPQGSIALWGSPKENWEKSIAYGHEKIDQLFSMDQAYRYTPKGKAAIADSPRGRWTYATPPVPLLQGSNLCMKFFAQAGKILDRAGFTRAGRALSKHGNRAGSVFPKPKGTPEQINQHGQKILEDILEHPNKTIERLQDGSVKIYSPDGRGAFFKKDGSFRGFIEKQYE